MPRDVVATVVNETHDSKLTIAPKVRRLFATHASQWSCSVACRFRFLRDERNELVRDPDGNLIPGPCYANYGPESWTTNRLNRTARETNANPLTIAWVEASQIRGLRGDRDGRLHVVGDANSNVAAMMLADACRDLIAKGVAKFKRVIRIWTYTHSWRWVFRSSWGPVAVLASCETDDDVADATARGYPVALVRPHTDLRPVAGMRPIPCPQQTGKKADCASCMLCSLGDKLHGKAFIQFDPEGSNNNRDVMEQTLNAA